MGTTEWNVTRDAASSAATVPAPRPRRPTAETVPTPTLSTELVAAEWIARQRETALGKVGK